MAEIVLSNLTKVFGSLTAVSDLDLTIQDKEFVALLGPSGCGKSTTMNMIAGIESPTSGDIIFGGRSVLNVAPERRGVGFVFQNYAIFTHLTVYENLAFGLRVRGVGKAARDAKVRQVADLVRLTDRLDWPSKKLSVNELQKLAIGRSAIVEPSTFLLDEPLSNLDAAFREFMRTELKHIQHELQQTMVYVTHDQVEAMSLADRIAVMDRGMLQQYATPEEIYNRPANLFVANFIGSPSMNLLPCRKRTEGDDTLLDFGPAGTIKVTDAGLAQAAAQANSEVILGVRPEAIVIPDAASDVDGLHFELDLLEPIGPRSILHLRRDPVELLVVQDKRFVRQLDRAVTAVLPQNNCHLFDPESGQALRKVFS